VLIKITDYSQIDERQLMDIYAEGNLENTDFFHPEMTDKKAAVKEVEAGFLNFLKNEFFARVNSTYWILEEKEIWVSALRISQIRSDLYYLEALETRPEYRGEGYASQLLTSVITELKENGSFCLCDCVSKKNTASIKTHLKCGFRIISEAGYDYLQKESDSKHYGLEFRYSATQQLGKH
jgi:ribosomal protein S18 acetylase RimI-like enzyme